MIYLGLRIKKLFKNFKKPFKNFEAGKPSWPSRLVKNIVLRLESFENHVLADLDCDPAQTVRKEHIKSHIDYLINERRSVKDWSWVDAIHMAMPIYAQLAAIERDPSYYGQMHESYMFTRDRQGGSKKGGGSPLFNETDGLWYRDYKFDPPYTDKVETDRPCYWSRGCGWAYTALARVMTYADEALPAEYREQYTADYLKMSEALKDCQREDGFWSVSLAAPTNFGHLDSAGPETSGTALFVAGLAWGINEGLLDRAEYLPAVCRGWHALADDAVADDGFLRYVQGTGSSPEDSQPIIATTVPDFEDFGYGCLLLAASEVYRLGDVDLNEGAGLEAPTLEASALEPEIVKVEYFTLDGRPLATPAPAAVTIQRLTLSDGSSRTSKIVRAN